MQLVNNCRKLWQGSLLVSHLQLRATELRDSREENLTWPSGDVTQGSEGREAAMLETFLAGPWCCQCDPALPWCSWTIRFTRNRVSFVDLELPLDVRLYHGRTLPSCSAA